MAKIRITIAGTNVKEGEKSEKLRESLLKVAVTANPLAKTPTEAVKFFKNPLAVADGILSSGNPTDEICFYEIPEGSREESKVASYTLQNFSNRIRLTASAELYTGTIFTVKSDKQDNGKSEQESDW